MTDAPFVPPSGHVAVRCETPTARAREDGASDARTTPSRRRRRHAVRLLRSDVGRVLAAALVGPDCPPGEYDDVVDRAIAVLSADPTDLSGALEAVATALDEFRGETMSPACRRDVARRLESVTEERAGPGEHRPPSVAPG